jgi:hypothetical protein
VWGGGGRARKFTERRRLCRESSRAARTVNELADLTFWAPRYPHASGAHP